MKTLQTVGRDSVNHMWCGPTALASITGKSYMEIEATIKKVTGRSSVTWCYLRELAATLEVFGYQTEVICHRGEGRPYKSTFAQFMRQRSADLMNSFIVANVTRHFVAVKGDMVCDTDYTELQPMPFASIRTGAKWKRLAHYLVVGQQVMPTIAG